MCFCFSSFPSWFLFWSSSFLLLFWVLLCSWYLSLFNPSLNNLFLILFLSFNLQLFTRFCTFCIDFCSLLLSLFELLLLEFNSSLGCKELFLLTLLVSFHRFSSLLLQKLVWLGLELIHDCFVLWVFTESQTNNGRLNIDLFDAGLDEKIVRLLEFFSSNSCIYHLRVVFLQLDEVVHSYLHIALGLLHVLHCL